MKIIHCSDLMNPRGLHDCHQIHFDCKHGYEMSLIMNRISAVANRLKSDETVIWDSGNHRITLWVESEQTETLLRMQLA